MIPKINTEPKQTPGWEVKRGGEGKSQSQIDTLNLQATLVKAWTLRLECISVSPKQG